MSPIATLHFVYNVDGTPGALLRDFIHRIRDPETYPCRLCDLTYGRFIKKAEWSRFVAELPVRARFHLRGSFWQRFPKCRDEPVPAVFVEESPGVLRTLISAEELRSVADLEALETLLASRVGMLSIGSSSHRLSLEPGRNRRSLR
jgi:hypothetical protein